jgi:hypothetical protein
MAAGKSGRAEIRGRWGRAWAALAALTSTTACGYQPLARTDIHDGPGAVSLPNPQASNYTADPAVPGGFKTSITVTSAHVADLRNELVRLFGTASVHEVPDFGTNRAHAALFLNPATPPAGALLCTGGVGNTCLLAHHAPSRAVLFASALAGRRPIVDDRLLTGAATLFDDATLDLGANLPFRTAFTGDTRDLEIRVVLAPDQLRIARENYGGQVQGALELPFAMNLPNPLILNGACDQGRGSGILTNDRCQEVKDDVDAAVQTIVALTIEVLLGLSPTNPNLVIVAGSLALAYGVGLFNCDSADVRVRANRLPGGFGLAPSTPENCDPLAAPQALLDLENVLDGRGYRQGCLRVDPRVRIAPGIAKFDNLEDAEGSGADLAIGIDLQCAVLIGGFCTVLDGAAELAGTPDCDDMVLDVAETQANRQLGQLAQNIQDNVRPFFTYAGEAFRNPPDRANACNPIDPNCRNRILDDFLPAAVTRSVYGWFANPFSSGISKRSPLAWEYPVTRVSSYTTCPPGTPVFDRWFPGQTVPERWCGANPVCAGSECSVNASRTPANGCGFPLRGQIVGGLADICQLFQPRTGPPVCTGRCVSEQPQNGRCFADPAVCRIDAQWTQPAVDGSALVFEYAVDSDADGTIDEADKCPNRADDQGDRDEDGIGDACDNCPNVFNPPEAPSLVQPDRDGDRLGDICDWDPNVRSENVIDRNCNFEAELGLFDPGWQTMNNPVAASTEAASRYRNAFRDQSFEPVPCPRFFVGQGALPVNPLRRTGAPLEPSASILTCAGEPGFRPLDICTRTLTNRIVDWPEVPTQPNLAGFQHPATGLTGTVGVNWCPCASANNNSPEKRASCRSSAGCRAFPQDFGRAPWRGILTAPDRPQYRNSPIPCQTNADCPGGRSCNLSLSGGRTCNMSCQTDANCPTGYACTPLTGSARVCITADWVDAPSTAYLSYPFVNQPGGAGSGGTAAAERLWDITTLGAGCTNPSDPGDVQCVASHPRVLGVLWKNLRAMSELVDVTNPGQLVATNTIQERGSTFWSGNAGYTTHYGGNLDDFTRWQQVGNKLIDYRCLVDGCGGANPVTPILVKPDFPTTVDPGRTVVTCLVTGRGCSPIDAGATLGTARPIIAGLYTNANNVWVSASEARPQLYGTGSTQVLRGVVFDRANGQLIQAVTSSGVDGPVSGVDLRLEQLSFGSNPSVQATTSFSSGPGRIADPQGTALSASRPEVLVFGSNTGLIPGDAAWLLSFPDQWTRFPLQLGRRPADVLAATYHAADDRYYEIDVVGVLTKLRRWTRGSPAFETLALVPPVWLAFDKHWLVSGPSGDLIYAGAGIDVSALVRLTIDPTTGFLRVTGAKLLDDRLVTAPIPWYGEVVVATEPFPARGSPVRKVIPHSDFLAPQSWWPDCSYRD